MIFLYPSGIGYKCCVICARSSEELDLSNFAVRQTLMDMNNINTPKVSWLLLAVSKHCINARIDKTLQSYESTVEKLTAVVVIFRIPTTVFSVSDPKVYHLLWGRTESSLHK